MKIYKIAQTQQFNIVQSNPSAETSQNLTIQIQNLHSAQQAFNFLQDIATKANELKAKASNLENELGVDLNLATSLDSLIKQGIAKTSAVNFLVQMNLLPSVDKIFDASFTSTIETQIAKNITSATQQMSSMNQNPQGQ